MHKESISFDGVKISIAIVLSILISSCNGQTSNDDTHDIESQKSNAPQNLTYTSTPAENQIDQVVRTMFQDSKGSIWFGTESGAFKLADKTLVHIEGIEDELGNGVTIKDISEDKDGTIWFGHTDGISSLNGERVTNYDESDGLISNDVWCIEADTRGHIWIGTIEGVCVFDGHTFVHFELPEGTIDSTVGVSSAKMIHHIFQDHTGRLWFSSNAGLFSFSDNTLVDVSSEAGIRTHFVNSVFEDQAGGLWISTKEGLYNLKENMANNITAGKIEVGKGIGSMAEDRDGNMWFVSNQHHLYTYDGERLVAFQKSADNKGPVVFQIYKDQDDRLWFVGYGGAYRLENGRFVHITKDGPW